MAGIAVWHERRQDVPNLLILDFVEACKQRLLRHGDSGLFCPPNRYDFILWGLLVY